MTIERSLREVAAIDDVCTACGERNPAGSAFCVYCGVYLGWDQPGARPREEAPAEEPAAQQAAPLVSVPAAPSVASSSAPPPPAPEPVQRPGESPCPQCGHPNGPTLKFCGKCGHVLRSTQAAAAPVTPVRQSWWRRLRDPADRQARRSYRRSLPAFYRWRRVLVSVISAGLVLALLSIVGRNPVSWARDRWYDVRGALVTADQVTYTAEPAGSVAKTYDVAALGSAPADDAWATAWGRPAPLKGCGEQPAARGTVRLTFADPVRVRALDVLAGLPPRDAQRPFLFRPSRLLVMYAGQCKQLDLKDTAEVQRLEFDTVEPVQSLAIAIGAAYPARTDARKNLVALTTVRVLTRP